MNLKKELLSTLAKIESELGRATSDEEAAILLNAKVNALTGLQNYEFQTQKER